MSENKIIIDGIDVSECDFFIDWYNVDESKFQDVQLKKILVTDLPKYLIGVPLYYLRQNLCDCYSCYCEENPNCYFKQLKRKEKKLEKIKILAKRDKELAKRYGEVDTLARVVLQIIEGEENE